MALRVLPFPVVLLCAMGVFQITASFACFIPSFVHDRVPEQFIPVWAFLIRPFYGESPNEAVVLWLARSSQVIIGVSEAVIGVSLLAAAFMPSRRRGLADFGLGFAAGLYMAFMLTMYAMHDKSLPNWNQYPAILAWITLTWIVVELDARRGGGRPAGSRAA